MVIIVIEETYEIWTLS